MIAASRLRGKKKAPWLRSAKLTTGLSGMKMSIAQLELFDERLPKKPYCSEALGNTLIRPATIARTMAYVQANHPNSRNCLIFDIDRPTAQFDWDDRGCPPPNLIALNPENGHGHLFYQLENPVHLNHESRKNPIRYCASVEAALRKKLDSDPAYVGPLSKNPLRQDRWMVTQFQPWSYSLDWLADWLDLEPFQDRRRRLPAEGLGRNCTLFDVTRFWAYKERRKPQSWFGYEFWEAAVLSYAMAHNDFPVPLTSNEVCGIGRSISKWVWANLSPEGFQKWGDARRAKSLEVRQEKAAETRAAILAVKEAYPSATQREIAAMVGCDQKTVSNTLRNL